MKPRNENEPKWLDNLRALITHRGLNPRALSIKAGLNATAVRDMLEGRAKFPRYDTVEALSAALGVTPAQLMGGRPETILNENQGEAVRDALADDDLNLLTEIITRLQEAVQEHKHALKPQDFAAMVTTLYRQINAKPVARSHKVDIMPHIDHLMTYETLRRRAGKSGK